APLASRSRSLPSCPLLPLSPPVYLYVVVAGSRVWHRPNRAPSWQTLAMARVLTAPPLPSRGVSVFACLDSPLSPAILCLIFIMAKFRRHTHRCARSNTHTEKDTHTHTYHQQTHTH